MIIFGTRGVTYTQARGRFHCPHCGEEADHRHKRVRQFFTLYFIPCIPLQLLGEYVECQECEETFHLDVLEYNPREEQRRFESELHRSIRRLMVQMVISDGDIDDEEITAVQAVYREITETALDADTLRAECAEAEPCNIAVLVGTLGTTLNPRGKEMVLRAAVRVAAADGDFAAEEQELAASIGSALEMSPAHVRGVVAEAFEHASA